MKELKIRDKAIDNMKRAFHARNLGNSCHKSIGCGTCLLCGIARAAGIEYTDNIGSLKNIENILSKTKFYIDKHGALHVINTDTGRDIERNEKRIDILFGKLFKCNI